MKTTRIEIVCIGIIVVCAIVIGIGGLCGLIDHFNPSDIPQ
jgi:hypothetical protein